MVPLSCAIRLSPSPWTGVHVILRDTVRAGAGLGVGLGRYFAISVPATVVARVIPAFTTSRRVKVESAGGVFGAICLFRLFCSFLPFAMHQFYRRARNRSNWGRGFLRRS